MLDTERVRHYGRCSGGPREEGGKSDGCRVWNGYFGYTLTWPTYMFSQGVGHGDGNVKTALHECQQVILGV